MRAPTVQTALATAGDDDAPALSADGYELFYTSDSSGTKRAYRATWSSAAGQYTAPAEVTELSSGAGDYEARLGTAGRALVFASNRLGPTRLFSTRRPSLGAAFDTPTLIEDVDADGVGRNPALAMDGSALLFDSVRAMPGFSTAFTRQIYAADDAVGGYGTPYPLVFDDFERPILSAPCPLADGSLLLSAAAWAGAGVGALDLYVATPQAGVVDTRGLLPRTFSATNSRAGHGPGHAEVDGSWTADPTVDVDGNMLYGPYTREIPPGSRRASFVLRVGSTSASGTAVANLDVYAANRNQKIGEQVLSWGAFSSTSNQSFDVTFTAQEGDVLEFRVYFLDQVRLTVTEVTIH